LREHPDLIVMDIDSRLIQWDIEAATEIPPSFEGPNLFLTHLSKSEPGLFRRTHGRTDANFQKGIR